MLTRTQRFNRRAAPIIVGVVVGVSVWASGALLPRTQYVPSDAPTVTVEDATGHAVTRDMPACPTEDSYAPKGCYWDAPEGGRSFIATGTSEADLTITYLED